MARSAAPGLPLAAADPLHDWGCRGAPDPEGYCSSSPAPSPDSCGLSSPASARAAGRGPAALRSRGGAAGGRKAVRGAGGPRQSASEREKLRMRRLAQALLRLRHYLPPALAPAGQSLTKVETLRLATRYIAHLSALLGLADGAPPRRCPLCPGAPGCCQPAEPRSHPAPAASPLGSAGWASPAAAGIPPELRGAGAPGARPGPWGSPRRVRTSGTLPEALGVADVGLLEAWGSPPYIPAMGTPAELHGAPVSIAASWSSPLGSLGAGTPPELHGAVTCNASSWLSPLHCAEPGTPPDFPSDPLLDAGLVLPEFLDAGTVTQDLSADLLSLLEALLPPQPHE
ncbi:MESP1 protein, partial [Rhinopomastus cyanomelas]|nr:MESP1 protein [Rhinopomastus cyanomelas]